SEALGVANLDDAERGRDGGAVRPVGAHQDRAVEQSRLERIVAALRDERAADEHDAGEAVEETELAEPVDEMERRRERLAARAPRRSGQESRHLVAPRG